jgi:Domain of unknown function (DUF5666)
MTDHPSQQTPDPQPPAPPEPDPMLAAALQNASDRPSGPSKLTMGLVAAVVLVAGFVGGFFVGGSDDSKEAGGPGGIPAVGGDFPLGGQAPGGGRAPVGGGDFTAGTITSVDGDTLTITTADGSTVEVDASDATVTLTEDGSVSDLKAGDSVVVSGENDGTGRITADSVDEGGRFLRGAQSDN